MRGIPRVNSVVIILVLLIVAALTLAGCNNSNSSGNQPAIFQPQQILHTNNLVNGIISVRAGGYYDQPFNVTSNMSRATVIGTFSARAALGDNIEVYILNDLAFANWSHGSSPPSGVVYNSGRITTDNINVSISPGNYHLVLNNSYSLVSTKQVTASIDLQWYQ